MKLEVQITSPIHVVIEAERPEEQSPHARFTFQTANNLKYGGLDMATMQVNTYATLSVEWKDKGGNPAKVDGATVWTSTNPDILAATVATGNSLICNVYAPGEIGKATVEASADADMGEGVKKVSKTIEIEVTTGEAVEGEITFTQNAAQGGASAKPAPAGGKPIAPNPQRR